MHAAILTVFRSGGDFRPEHVERLYRQCDKYPFLCLSDVDLSLPHYRMWHDWPGWWGKIEAFRLRGPILYMDLDTTVVGDLQPLLDAAMRYDFVALRNPWRTPSRFGTGLMAWRGDMSGVYKQFLTAPGAYMNRYSTRKAWGDQGFIADHCAAPVLWQDLFPGEILSWKADCEQGVPNTARVVYFHGTPRPWEVGK